MAIARSARRRAVEQEAMIRLRSGGRWSAADDLYSERANTGAKFIQNVLIGRGQHGPGESGVVHRLLGQGEDSRAVQSGGSFLAQNGVAGPGGSNLFNDQTVGLFIGLGDQGAVAFAPEVAGGQFPRIFGQRLGKLEQGSKAFIGSSPGGEEWPAASGTGADVWRRSVPGWATARGCGCAGRPRRGRG